MEAFGLAAAKRDLESDGLLEEDVMELLLSSDVRTWCELSRALADFLEVRRFRNG